MIARYYMEYLGGQTKHDVDKLIAIAPVHHGTYIASVGLVLNLGLPSSVTNALGIKSNTIILGQLSPGSSFLNKLNYGLGTGPSDDSTLWSPMPIFNIGGVIISCIDFNHVSSGQCDQYQDGAWIQQQLDSDLSDGVVPLGMNSPFNSGVELTGENGFTKFIGKSHFQLHESQDVVDQAAAYIDDDPPLIVPQITTAQNIPQAKLSESLVASLVLTNQTSIQKINVTFTQSIGFNLETDRNNNFPSFSLRSPSGITMFSPGA